MLEKFESWQIMFFLYVISSVFHIWYIKLEDNNESPSLQKFLMVLSIITGFLSLPISLVSLIITYFRVSRIERRSQAEIDEIMANKYGKNNYTSDSLYSRIAKYDSWIEDDRKRSYNDGYNTASKETQLIYKRKLEYARSDGYRDGYADGQKDYPLGINLLAELDQ